MKNIVFNYQTDSISTFKKARRKMVTKLTNSEHMIVNQLLDNGLFTSHPYKPSKDMLNAVNVLRQTRNQQRINIYLRDLIGIQPENIQENLLLMFGEEYEDSETVHVLLATLKTIINLPELQTNQSDRTVLTQMVIRQVNSEVVELDEKSIRQIVTEIFVDQFKLFTLDYPEFAPSEQNQEVTEYWHINPDFNTVAQAIVNCIKKDFDKQIDLTTIQKINQQLLIHRYIGSRRYPELWNYLYKNKSQIAEQWAALDRFDLEIGDSYALLLDKKRQQIKSKPAVTAISVAKSIRTGISQDKLNTLIKERIDDIFPNNYIALSQVKESLMDLGLIAIKNEFIFPTPIVQRFDLEERSKGNDNE